MKGNLMKILIIEDDLNDCNAFKKCVENRQDIEIVGITDSDIEGLQLVKVKHPEGIILDLELNESTSGNTDSFEFLQKIKKPQENQELWAELGKEINLKKQCLVLLRR